MNLHVTNDDYGFFPSEIAKRIRNTGHLSDNLLVNLSTTSHFRDEMITYIEVSTTAFKKYIKSLPPIDKIIFHPYNVNSYRFLTQILKRFPDARIYWACWSYELYNQPEFVHRLYEPFSTKYLKRVSMKALLGKIWMNVRSASLYNYSGKLRESYSHIHYFCSFLPADFDFLMSISEKKDIRYLPFAYLSLNNIIPNMDTFRATGNKVMIGHSASPQGNHFEVLEKLSAIDNSFEILLPLAYGDKKYAALIKNAATERFKHVLIQEEKLATNDYYQFLTQASWVIMNVKVQQGLGNILALVWMGAKLFLDKNTSTYKDFTKWGIAVYSLEEITKEALTHKLSHAIAEKNRSIILERFNETVVKAYWEPLLT